MIWLEYVFLFLLLPFQVKKTSFFFSFTDHKAHIKHMHIIDVMATLSIYTHDIVLDIEREVFENWCYSNFKDKNMCIISQFEGSVVSSFRLGQLKKWLRCTAQLSVTLKKTTLWTKKRFPCAMKKFVVLCKWAAFFSSGCILASFTFLGYYFELKTYGFLFVLYQNWGQ